MERSRKHFCIFGEISHFAELEIFEPRSSGNVSGKVAGQRVHNVVKGGAGTSVPTTASGLPATTYLTWSRANLAQNHNIWRPSGGRGASWCGRVRWRGRGAAADSQHHDASRTDAVDKLCMSPVYMHTN